MGRIRHQLAVPCGTGRGSRRGYGDGAERFEKQRHLQALQARLRDVEARLGEGRVSICRAGRALARARHHLDADRLSEEEWRQRWKPARWFLCADGEADKAWGNETIRWHPDEGWLEVKLPAALAHLANRPHGRYRLSVTVAFPYRGDEVAAQAASGAIRYDIFLQPERRRWYLDASRTTPSAAPAVGLAELRQRPVLGVDLNTDHLAAVVVDPSGNPVGPPVAIRLALAGVSHSRRDGRLRAAISTVLRVARAADCAAVVIENLNFEQARAEGREHHGRRRPSRGRRGRAQRRMLSGFPTGRFRDRLVQMATNLGIAVVAVDPAYTSTWGAQHWLRALRQHSPDATAHHSAAVVIGRRGLGQRARRREGCDWSPPEDGQQRATNSAEPTIPAKVGRTEPPNRKPGNRKAPGRPPQWRCKTQTADRAPPGDQATEDRSRPPTKQGPAPLSAQERSGPPATALARCPFPDASLRLALSGREC